MISSQNSPSSIPQWKQNLTKARRSTLIKIINNTNCTLILKERLLEKGNFELEPPGTILPGQTIEFGAIGKTSMEGTKGSATYYSVNNEGDFCFAWSNPKLPTQTIFCYVPTSFQLIQNVTGDKNNTLIFDVNYRSRK
eukprot:TRINITY_DN6502_c0_g1_i1.p1 TRINITY_DN6502_c0_g1~~TRINITY_DN6502_c0_g1_i1.p1  ORF type:complete len:138 (+),score=62.49 TRINITY_DN6502_c0_g1_i1:37-450(+)